MLNTLFLSQRLRKYLATPSLGQLTPEEFHWLLIPSNHFTLVKNRRAEMILSRTRLIAAILAFLTPLWTFIDYFAFSRELWLSLAVGRIIATIALAALFIYTTKYRQACEVQVAISLLLAIPTLFYLISAILLQPYQLTGFAQTVAATHVFLPFLLLVGLSVFPLTVAECFALAFPVLLAKGCVSIFIWPLENWPAILGTFWLLLLVTVVSTLGSVGQLAFVIALVRQTIREPLTGCFSRQSTEELLDLQFTLSVRNKTPLSIAFADLDRFKEVNDQFGHDAGDNVLKKTVDHISKCLRQGDILGRWGGEEFVLVMPNTDLHQAHVALDRMQQYGLGTRPDGRPQTISIGVAERTQDAIESSEKLIELADSRMYQAKQAGRNRICSARNNAG